MIDQSETGTSNQMIIVITLLGGRCTTLLCLSPALANSANMLGQKPFGELNWHVLTFFIQFYFAGLCTEHRWDALRVGHI
jgi:hypothetical protein